VDISPESLADSAVAIAERYSHVQVHPVCQDFTTLKASFEIDSPGRRVVYFPGSTIGNLPPKDAAALLQRTARLCRPGGGLLLGVDLKKAPHLIHAAYNDAQGVTAAFNVNVLTRINRELAGDFNLSDFWHHAFYQPVPGRI